MISDRKFDSYLPKDDGSSLFALASLNVGPTTDSAGGAFNGVFLSIETPGVPNPTPFDELMNSLFAGTQVIHLSLDDANALSEHLLALIDIFG